VYLHLYFASVSTRTCIQTYTQTHSISDFLSFCLCLALSRFLYLPVALSVSLCLSLSLSSSLFVSVSICFFVFQRDCLSVCLSLSTSILFSVTFSLTQTHSLYVCLCLSFFLSFSSCLAFFLSYTHIMGTRARAVTRTNNYTVTYACTCAYTHKESYYHIWMSGNKPAIHNTCQKITTLFHKNLSKEPYTCTQPPLHSQHIPKCIHPRTHTNIHDAHMTCNTWTGAARTSSNLNRAARR